MINQTMMNYLRMGWSKDSGKKGDTGGSGEGRGDPPSSPAPPSPRIPMKNEEAKRAHPWDPRNVVELVKYHQMLNER